MIVVYDGHENRDKKVDGQCIVVPMLRLQPLGHLSYIMIMAPKPGE